MHGVVMRSIWGEYACTTAFLMVFVSCPFATAMLPRQTVSTFRPLSVAYGPMTFQRATSTQQTIHRDWHCLGVICSYPCLLAVLKKKWCSRLRIKCSRFKKSSPPAPRRSCPSPNLRLPHPSTLFRASDPPLTRLFCLTTSPSCQPFSSPTPPFQTATS